MMSPVKTTRSCPECGAALTSRDILAAGPFPCPSCQVLLQAPDSYGYLTALGSISLATAALVTLGFRGLHLLYSVLVVLVPVVYMAINCVKYVILPKIEIYLPEDAVLHLRNRPRR